MALQKVSSGYDTRVGNTPTSTIVWDAVCGTDVTSYDTALNVVLAVYAESNSAHGNQAFPQTALWYREDGGTWTQVTGATAVQMATNGALTDNDPVGNSAGCQTTVNDEEWTTATGGTFNFTYTGIGEAQFGLDISAVGSGVLIEFSLNDGAIALDASITTAVSAATYDYTRDSETRISLEPSDDKSQLSDTRIQILGTDYTRLSNTTIEIITDYTRLSDTRILATTDYIQLSNSAIKRGGYADKFQLSDTTIVNQYEIEPLSDTRIKREPFADYTRLSNSAIKRESYADKSQASDTRIKREAILDYTRPSNTRVKKEPSADYTRLSDTRIKLEPSDDYTRLSDTRISTITDYTRTSIAAVKRLSFADIQIASSTRIAGPIDVPQLSNTAIKRLGFADYTRVSNTRIVWTSTIDVDSGTSIKREGFNDQSQLSDARIQTLGTDYTRPSNTTIQKITDYTLMSSSRIRKEMPQIDELSSTRVKVLAEQIDVLSDAAIILRFDNTTLSDVLIKATQELPMLSGAAITIKMLGREVTLTSGTYIRLADLNLTDIKAKFTKIHGIKAATRRVID